jgi:hypothetical protein
LAEIADATKHEKSHGEWTAEVARLKLAVETRKKLNADPADKRNPDAKEAANAEDVKDLA